MIFDNGLYLYSMMNIQFLWSMDLSVVSLQELSIIEERY